MGFNFFDIFVNIFNDWFGRCSGWSFLDDRTCQCCETSCSRISVLRMDSTRSAGQSPRPQAAVPPTAPWTCRPSTPPAPPRLPTAAAVSLGAGTKGNARASLNLRKDLQVAASLWPRRQAASGGMSLPAAGQQRGSSLPPA